MQPFRFGYTLKWTRENDLKLSVNRVVATRIGLAPGNPNRRQITIDFNGPKLAGLTETNLPVAIANAAAPMPPSSKTRFLLFPPTMIAGRCSPARVSWKPGNKDPVDIRCTFEERRRTFLAKHGLITGVRPKHPGRGD